MAVVGIDDDLVRRGAVVVSGAPVDDDAALLALIGTLGEPSAVGNGDGLIHEVRPRPLEERRDLSSTAAEFPLHTDSTALRFPHHYVGLACATATPAAGGESLVLHVEELVAALVERHGPEPVAALAEPVFPFPLNDPSEPGRRVQDVAVLSAGPGGRPWIRYRADALGVGLALRPEPLERRHRTALGALEETLGDSSLATRHSLVPGEVLLLDNRRTLHGRTAIRPGAPRHLRRLKAYRRPPRERG